MASDASPEELAAAAFEADGLGSRIFLV